jgi:hypothetical protein
MRPFTLLLLGTLAATAGADSIPQPLVTRRLIKPSLTGPGIGACADDECPDREHKVYLFRGVTVDHPWVPPKLLVILGAHCRDAAPEAGPYCHEVFDVDYEPLAQVALRQGFRVIELDYPNRRPPSQVCDGAAASCYEQLRQEVAFGDDTSDQSDLGTHRQDAIAPRLLRLLRYLDALYPSEGWDRWTRFDSADGKWRVHWPDVVLAGNSGYAAFIAFKREVSRAVMFAEPADRGSASASHWTHDTPSTSPDRFYGFVHTQDDVNGNTYDRVVDNWSHMAVPFPLVSVDGVPVPDAHQLETSQACEEVCPPHFKVVQDEAKYAAVWRHLLGFGN